MPLTSCISCLPQLTQALNCISSCVEQAGVPPAYPASVFLFTAAFSLVSFLVSLSFSARIRPFLAARILSLTFLSLSLFTALLTLNAPAVLHTLPFLLPIVAISSSILSYSLSFRLVTSQLRFLPLRHSPLNRSLVRWCRRLRLPRPALYIYFSKEPGAFAIDGFRKAVFLSDSLLARLSPREHHAVLLHELYHLSRHSGRLKNLARSFSLLPFPVHTLEKTEEKEIDHLLSAHRMDMAAIRKKLWGNRA